MSPFFRKLTWLAQRRRKEDDLREELQFHLEEEADDRRAAGLAASEAQRAARRDLGNLTLIQEETRDAWVFRWLEQFLQDARYGLRTMAANKTFSALAILSLALGIGANTAIYSFMDAILLRSLPVSDPASLVIVNWHNTVDGMRGTVMHGASGSFSSDKMRGSTGGIFPYPVFELLRTTGSVFSSVFAYYPTRQVHLMLNGQAEVAGGEFVSGDYFRGLAVAPSAGRAIVADDDRPGAPPIVVLSYAFSEKHFADPALALGQPILINDQPFTIAGVAPPSFFGTDPAQKPDFFVPLHTNLLLKLRGGANEAKDYLDEHYYWLQIAARRNPGVTLAQAQAALATVFNRWVSGTAQSAQEREHLPVLLLQDGGAGVDTLRQEYSAPLYVLLTMVGLILAIACANIANLMLARATARRREMAVRLSMGAGRFRVIRQLLTESLVLAGCGGALGVAFAVWGIRSLKLLLRNAVLDPTLNWHVLGITALLSILTGLLAGLAPALAATRADVMPSLKLSRADRVAGRTWLKGVGLGQALVVTQIGLSLLMLVAAALFARTLANLHAIELGFQREGILTFRMNARQAGHRDPEIVSFYEGLLAQFRALPGVTEATVTHSPLIGSGTWMGAVIPAGVVADPDNVPTTHILMTGSDFFQTLQIPVIKGRALDERDRAGAPPVVVVNQAYVDTFFKGENPLGRHVVITRRKPFGPQDVEIVGIAKNARYGGIRGAFEPIAYLSYTQNSYYPVEEMTYFLRTAGDPLTYASTVRSMVKRADPRVPVTAIQTEAMQIDRTLNQEIIFARLCSGFAILALVISCIGLYGTMAYTVSRRTGEIGIRMALGAPRGTVLWMVLREVLIMAVVGLALSVPAALRSSKLVESFLFGVKPDDPQAVELAVAILLIAALLAGFVPARRASQIDPLTAVRHE